MEPARKDLLETPEKDASVNVSFASVGNSASPGQDSVSSDTEQDSPKAKDWRRMINQSERGDCSKTTVISDSVHKHIEVPEICQAILDTPQFDRLRNIRQLGTTHYVYPCAKHSRFEHSVGVMYLAGRFIERLRLLYPECCDTKDQLCVMIAGLCHDLGHGPFSHLWEDFMKEARPERKWSHEESSLKMLDFLIEENNL
jgi:hypothetical protein